MSPLFADRDLYDVISFFLGVIGFGMGAAPFILRWRKRALDQHDALFEMSKSFEAYRAAREKDLSLLKQDLAATQERLQNVDPERFIDQAKDLAKAGAWADLDRQSLGFLLSASEAIALACETLVEQRILDSDTNAAVAIAEADRFATLGLAARPGAKSLQDLAKLARIRAEGIARGEPVETLNWEGMSDVELNSLSYALAKAGKRQLAEIAARRSVPLARLRTGEASVNYSVAAGQHANTLCELGCARDAETIMRHVLDVTAEMSGDTNRLDALHHNTLAAALHLQGRNDEAEREFVKAVQVARTSLGDGHPETLAIAANFHRLISAHLPASPHRAGVEAILASAR